MTYFLVVGVTVAVFAILALSLNIIAGYAGQPHLGQAAFFGLGAYTAAILSTRYGVSFWLDLPAALLVAGLVGVILGVISLRLARDFLAITTIGINFVMVAIFQYVPFFGGAMGIPAIPSPAIGGHEFGYRDFFLTALVLVVLVAALSAYLERTWFGAALKAIKDDEQAAAAVGIQVASYKIAAFVLGTALAGLAGGFYAHFMSVVTPNGFGFPVSVSILSMLVFGGLGTIRGAMAGAILLGILPEVFRFISNYRLLVYGFLLLFMVRFQPQGIVGEDSWLVRRIARLAAVLRTGGARRDTAGG